MIAAAQVGRDGAVARSQHSDYFEIGHILRGRGAQQIGQRCSVDIAHIGQEIASELVGGHLVVGVRKEQVEARRQTLAVGRLRIVANHLKIEHAKYALAALYAALIHVARAADQSGLLKIEPDETHGFLKRIATQNPRRLHHARNPAAIVVGAGRIIDRIVVRVYDHDLIGNGYAGQVADDVFAYHSGKIERLAVTAQAKRVEQVAQRVARVVELLNSGGIVPYAFQKL